LVESLITPLTILDRGDIVVALHKELLRRGEAGSSEDAVLALAKFGDWERAFAILEEMDRDGANPRFNLSMQDLLWNHAYLQGHAGTILPKLAAIPFDRDVAHAKDLRSWRLLAYQIRAGRSDVCVPVIEPNEQTHGYADAAVMQIAELVDDPAEARTVRELRRVAKIEPVRMEFPQRGVSFNVKNFSHELLKAEIEITARRKDYAKAAILAQSPSHHSYKSASDLVIDAFIDEGDWHGAAEIARQHDPRDNPPPEGFDGNGPDEYLQLQEVLAAAAARSGDHTAARSFLFNYARALSTAILEAENSETDMSEVDIPEADIDLSDVCLFMATIFAGAAENLLAPRQLRVLLRTFRH